MIKEDVFIWGAGGHGRGILDIFRKSNEFNVAYFIDNNDNLKGQFVDGVEVLGGKDVLGELKNRNVKKGIIGIGDCKTRCELSEFIKNNGFSLVNAIDPTAIISPTAKIGEGVTIWAGSIIGTHVIIENNVVINDGIVIGHDSIIRFGAHLAGGVRLAGGVEIGEKTFIGLGAIIFCNKIGKNSMIGAGSVVSWDIIDNVIAVGFPARIVKKRD